MSKTLFTATFRNGETFTRSSEAAYTHASRHNGRVRFHLTREAAIRVPANAEVVRVGDDAPAITVALCDTCGGPPRPGSQLVRMAGVAGLFCGASCAIAAR